MELARLDGEELQHIRRLVAAMTQGAGSETSSALDASEACRRMLMKAGALTSPDDKLTLTARPGRSFPGIAEVDTAMYMRMQRDVVAGGTEATLTSDLTGKWLALPSMVVGELESS